MTKEDSIVELKSEDPEARRRATARLAESDVGAHISELLLALGDSDWRVRKEAVSVARRASPSPLVLRGLVEAIGPGQNVGLRNAAVEALAAYGADAVDALAVALPNLDADGRKLATEALALSEHPTALLILEGLIEDADPNVRATALEAIAQIGASLPDAASSILLARLKAETGFERLAALDGLNQLGAVMPWSVVEGLMDDPILARPALLAAGRTRSQEALRPLAMALGTTRGTTFDAALTGLCELTRSGGPIERVAREVLHEVEGLSEKLIQVASPATEDLGMRRMATLLLGNVASEAAARALVSSLIDDHVTAEAEEGLLTMGPDCTDAIIWGLEQDDAELRARCVELLGRMYPESAPEAVVHAVSKRLDDSDSHVVRVALETLAPLGNERVLLKVAEILTCGSGAVRWSAETALGEIARRYPDAARRLVESAQPQGAHAVAAAVVIGALADVQPLMIQDEEFLNDVLAHESRFARRAALDALAHARTGRAVDSVAFALTDEHRDVQFAAIRTLGRMRDASGRAPGLEHLLPLVEQATDDDLLAHAVAALGQTGGAEAVRSLRPLTRSAPAPVAVSAIEAIASIPEIRHVDELLDALAHPSPEVVKSGLGVLAGLDDPRVAAHIGACLDHEAWDVRRLAADLLGQRGGEANVSLLRAKLHVEREPLVVDAISRALEAAGALRRTPSPAKGGSLAPR